MKLILQPEYALTADHRRQIHLLRKECFTDNEITNHYGKQLPTARILVFEAALLIGHIGLMLRMIRINEEEIRTMGIQDVIVSSAYRGKGIMSQMINKAEEVAQIADCAIMMLFASEPEIYEHLGFESVVVDMQWLKIHEGKNLGTSFEKVEETMIKFLTKDHPKEILAIDMLGHIF